MSSPSSAAAGMGGARLSALRTLSTDSKAREAQDPWHHRDRVRKDTASDNQAADTGRCVNLDVAVLVAIDRSGRTPRQATRIFTVQTHLRNNTFWVLLLATCTGRLI